MYSIVLCYLKKVWGKEDGEYFMLMFFVMYFNLKVMFVVIKFWVWRFNYWGGFGVVWNVGIVGCVIGLVFSVFGMCYFIMLVGYFICGCIYFNFRIIWIFMFNIKRVVNLWDVIECKFVKWII